jgi:anti-sigma regulatory factor (Ser/Thr protein kinase)
LDRAEAQFPCDKAAAHAARQFVEAALKVWALDDLVDVVTLLTSELVTNAVLHARTAFTVRAVFDDPELRVEVSDGGREHLYPATDDPYAAGGRGLLLVAALADRWGITGRPDGKTVWFVLHAA